MGETLDYSPNLYQRAKLFLGDIATAGTFRDEDGQKLGITSRIRVAKRFEELRKNVADEQNKGEHDD